MPFYKVVIQVEKDVFSWEKNYMRCLDDAYRYLEMKELVKGFNVGFDVTVDVNDFGELSTVFNFHRDYSNYQKKLTNFFDTTVYNMKEELSGLSVEVSINLVDKNRVPFTEHSNNLIGTCIVVDDYAAKCMETPNGMIFERTSKNKFFEVETIITFNKKAYV
jgi:hypothetical protein